MRRIVCKNVNNMRDLGGYLNKDGSCTKFNRFIRSNLPYNLSNKEINYLRDIGIRTIIDLRSEHEIKRHKNDLDCEYFNYYSIAISGEGCPSDEEYIPIGYMNILDNKKSIREVFKVISKSRGGVLFNCTAGKDRTGVIAMLLLLIADVYDDDIIADYQVSYTYLRKFIIKLHLDNHDLPYFLGLSKMEYMEKTLELFYSKYKNIHNYMNYIGIDSNEYNTIKDMLLK